MNAVVVVPQLKTGEVLLLRRSGTDPWKPLHWNFPGGKIDPGEEVTQAAVRELAEEAGIYTTMRMLRYLGIYQKPNWNIAVFLLPLAHKPKVESNDGEHDYSVWCRLSELPQPLIPGVWEIVGKL